MILAAYDLSGIQSFIFSTNKLAEIIGASVVIHRALFDNIPELLGEKADAWEQGEFSFVPGDTAKIVYIGGGNALMMFDTMEREKAFRYQLAERVFTESGGFVRLNGASIVLDEEKNLAENQNSLMQKLRDSKKMPKSNVSCLGFPVTAMDNNNFEPLVLVDGERTTRSSHAKLQGRKRKSFMPDAFLPNDKTKFALRFDEHRTEDGKNFIAVIHIDGNTMGMRIRSYAASQKGDVVKALSGLKKLSVRISGLYKDVLRDTIKAVYHNREGELPIRPIIADGDDITLMMESKKAFLFTKLFFENLETKGKILFADEFVPTAAAGIAFVKTKFPFSVAYDIAEECCKNAKKQTLLREGVAKSSIDFQVVYSGVSGSLSAMRKEYYMVDGNCLMQRPYVFDDSSPHAFNAFASLAQKLRKADKDGSIAVSKLKGLRNAYGMSEKSAENYGQYILAHANGIAERQIAEELARPFENGKAVFFDCLDVWDVAWEEVE